MYTLFVIILCHIIPVFINAFLFIFAYKVSHKERITIGKIFEYWNDKFKDSDGDSSLCLFLFIPGMNILFIFYTFFLSLYNIFKNIEV